MTLQQLCLSFKGRINRKTFWWSWVGILAAGVISIFVWIFIAEEVTNLDGLGIIVFLWIPCAAYSFISVAVIVKRLHDTNRSGLYALALLIPVMGHVYILVVCGFIKGTAGDNDYGPPAKEDLMTLPQCFSFKGRVNRKTYWWWNWVVPFLWIGFYFGFLVATGLIDTVDNMDNYVIELFLGLLIPFGVLGVLLFISVAVIVKRLHDTNRSGLDALSLLIPVIGHVYILVVCGFIKGTAGDNDYGPPS